MFCLVCMSIMSCSIQQKCFDRSQGLCLYHYTLLCYHLFQSCRPWKTMVMEAVFTVWCSFNFGYSGLDDERAICSGSY